MFTGIVQSLGQIRSIENHGSEVRFTIATGKLPTEQIQIGDSVSVNGVCLTAVQCSVDSFSADISQETLSCTTLGGLQNGTSVNLELALTPSTRMGGHIVSGHVDGVGVILGKNQAGESIRFEVDVPQNLGRYIAVKGSICLDGVSLTVNAVEENCIGMNMIPHTLNETTWGSAVVGQKVNVEIDLLSRYLERLLMVAKKDSNQLDLKTLERAGFF